MSHERAPEAVAAASASGHVAGDAASAPDHVPLSMTYPGAVAGVLRREGLDDPIFLGAGEDAWAFALSEAEAIRVLGGRQQEGTRRHPLAQGLDTKRPLTYARSSKRA